MSKQETKQPVAIVLGGTNPHIALIENLKNRGYYTILLDYYENPPAKEFAHEHIQESTLDQDRVLEVAKQKQADLVIATCVDQANVTACYVGEQLNLPHPYTYETARLIANKIEMKKKLKDSNIPTASFSLINQSDNLDKISLPPFPLVIKPGDTGGSKGVRKVNNKTELNFAVKRAFDESKLKTLLAESFSVGKNIDAVCFIVNGKANVIMLRERFGIRSETGAVLQYFHSLIPAGVTDNARRNIQQVAQSIANTFNLKNTPLHLQLIVSKEDVSVVEFAPRIGGGLSFKTVEVLNGFDLIKATIDTYFDVVPSLVFNENSYLFSEVNIYAKDAIFDKIGGLSELIKSKTIEVCYIYKRSGMKLNAEMASRDRVGSFIVKGDSVESLKGQIKKCIQLIEVFDTNNEPVMNKDIYKKLFA